MNLENQHLEQSLKSESILRLVEYALLRSRKANEGNKGVILEFDLSKMSPEDLRLLLPPETEIPSELLAAKILKIYTPGQAAAEAKMQDRAYDVINNPDNQNSPLAKIPKVYYNSEISVANPELDHYLESCGVNTVGGKVGMMLMDYVDGEDLATHLYHQVIEHDQKLADLKQRLAHGEDLSFNDISARVQSALGYQKPPHQAEQAVELKIEAKNADKLFSALKSYGFELDQAILDKLRNTIRLLHDNNIYHNDLHERNIMLVKDDLGKIIDVYLIDFDRASDIEDRSAAGSDIDIVNRYSIFTTTHKENSGPDQIFLRSIDRQKSLIERSKNVEVQRTWQGVQDKIENIIASGGPSMLQSLDSEIYLVASQLMDGGEESLKVAAALILDIAKNNDDLARQLVQLNIAKLSNAYTENFWRNLLKQL